MFSGSMVALVTPMQADDRIDFDALRRLIDLHIEAGTDCLVIAGTTGESATLTKTEHAEVIRVAAEHAGGRVPVIAGTGSNSTAQTIDLSVAVGDCPIDGYLVVTPYYNKPTQEGLFRHFSAVADAVRKPLLLYNVPGRTAVDLLPQTVARLSAHPRIAGIKEATGELARVPLLAESCASGFVLLSGDDASAREFMLAGGRGVISVTANVAPSGMAAMCRAAIAQDAAGAMEADTRLAGLHHALFLESNPIPVKWALQRLGLIGPGIRLPLTPLSPEHHAAVERALREAAVLQ